MAVPRPSSLLAASLGLAVVACSPPDEPTGTDQTATGAAPAAADGAASLPGAGLPDEAAERGLAYVNVSGRPDKPTVLEANGAGVALIDLESDGDLDVVFSQGLEDLDALVAGPGADLVVFRNDGRGRFERGPGPGLAGWWTGLAVGDVDGDGREDLVAGGFGDVAVLLQRPDGELVRVARAGVEPEGDLTLVPGAERAGRGAPAWATSLALFDADRDGALDLYVGRYLELDPVAPPRGSLGEGALALPCRWKGHEVFCGPRGLVPQRDRVYRGRGDGTFTDVTASTLRDPVDGYTLGVLPFDADGDGDTDLLVANDSSPNLLLVNRERDDAPAGDAGFELVDRAYLAGLALGAEGRPEAGMGVAAGDVDRDGRLDVCVTNFSDEPTGLFLATGRTLQEAPVFADVTFRYGLLRATSRLLSWSVHFVDIDGDGWLELFTANGHVYPQADRPRTGTSYGQPDTLFQLGPDARARELAPRGPGSILASATGTRGSAVGDLDGDGAPDLVLARIDGPAALGMNRTGDTARRLAVRCLGPERPDTGRPDTNDVRTPADGTGARVELQLDSGVTLVGEVQRTAGFQSSSTPWLHFGLGTEAHYAGLVVRWPSGRSEELPGGAADRRLIVREGAGVVAAEPLR